MNHFAKGSQGKLFFLEMKGGSRWQIASFIGFQQQFAWHPLNRAKKPCSLLRLCQNKDSRCLGSSTVEQLTLNFKITFPLDFSNDFS